MLLSISSSSNSGTSPRYYYPALTTTFHLLFLLLILLFSSPSKAQFTPNFPLPLPTTHFGRDPNIILYKNEYYLFSTTTDLLYFRASDLSGPWRPAGSVLPAGKGSIIQDKGDPNQPWAPTVIQYNDTFYCFYCVSTINTQNSSIGVATSSSLDKGTKAWTDHGAIINTLSGANADIYPYNVSNAIDPSIIIDPTDNTQQAWLTFGSYWDDIFQVPLSADLLSVENADNPAATHLAFNVSFPAEEASWISYRAPWFYLWYSKGYCCGLDINNLPPAGDEYSIQVGRSLHVSGPYLDKQNVSLAEGGGSLVYGSNHNGQVYAPGSSGVVTTSSGRDVLYYHYLNLSIGVSDGDAIIGYNYLDYNDGWPTVSSRRYDDVRDVKSAGSHVLMTRYTLYLYIEEFR
ncbi:endo-arabinanase, putative [Talaromyces stipitatus ATCC 10500]|uniref:Arabinan endo-1,5-alpha-L-arabinosidase n=1 Tax=Talaromyces stipitatus (strain ATCC 10500 / CBS 375.48 / QM 6759 / NRRL 1006) TaxID=441959 RepID=B8MTM2_TALSN|nr:endo-arabinanase, putative [Talaromyces stipitatus ATCC 10500]EED12428.1 endo-arabinanase, putative [Talaromyces stipitatus ATCC 10500]